MAHKLKGKSPSLRRMLSTSRIWSLLKPIIQSG